MITSGGKSLFESLHSVVSGPEAERETKFDEHIDNDHVDDVDESVTGASSSELGLENDIERVEVPWLEDAEDLLKRIRRGAQEASQLLLVKARLLKKLHHRYAIPSILIPLAMTPVTAALGEYEWLKYVQMCAFITSGCSGALATFMNHGSISERCYHFSSRYSDLVMEIDQELALPRRFREASDTFMIRIKLMYMSLNRAAPDA
eukprot:1493995-Pleurochrysis_carterae.AAC.2